MRSRLEAKYAAWLDQEGILWEYEPECFAGPEGQWLPDFRTGTGAGRRYVELKPRSLFCFNDGSVAARDQRVDEILSRMAIAWHSDPEATLQLEFLDYDREEPDIAIMARPYEPWRVYVLESPLLNAIWPGMGQLAAIPPANPYAAAVIA
jgi:hypothetical protein